MWSWCWQYLWEDTSSLSAAIPHCRCQIGLALVPRADGSCQEHSHAQADVLLCPRPRGASSALAAQRAKPVLGTSNTASAAPGRGDHPAVLSLGAHLLEPQGQLWACCHWTPAGKIPHGATGSLPPPWQRGEGRWARVKRAKLLGWNKGGFIEEEKPWLQAKQSREFIPL